MKRKNIRLPRAQYHSTRKYFVTLCCAKRIKFFASANAARIAIDLLLETAKKHDFAVQAYCFMPDHLHALVEGISVPSQLLPFVMDYKRKTTLALAPTAGGVLWQKKFYDHILRGKESPSDTAKYILMNPVRAGLCEKPGEYPFSGSTILHL